VRKKSRTRKTARPSNLPGKRLGRKAKPGPCARCGTVGPLLKRFCRRCYQHEIYLEHRRRIKSEDGPGEGSPAWVEDWLRQQVRNFLHSHPERTEEQVIELCRIIYLAKRHHNDKRGGYHPGDNYARREKLREEGDGHYLDRSVMPEIKSWTK